MTEENQNTTTKNHKLIKIIIIIAVVLIFGLAIYYFISKNNASSQIKDFKRNVAHNNYKELAQQLSTNERTMKKSEAKHLTNYFKKGSNIKRFNSDLKQVQNNLKSNKNTSDLGSIKDQSGKPIISFSKNGKQLLFLDKISMEPYYRKVFVKELDNNAIYDFDKEHKVTVDKNKTTKVGTFIVGDYDVPVKKVFKDGPVKGSVHGKIHINTNKKTDKQRIIATQDFNQTKIKIKLNNDDKLKSRKLYINDKLTELNQNKTYGYYPNNSSFEVKASGKIDDDTFKTNSVSVTQGIDNSTQIVNLNFNEKQIEKKLKTDKELEKRIKQFIKTYMVHLNEAYKKTDYSPIKKDIKSGSNAEKFMKPKFDSKQDIKYTSTKVDDIKKDGKGYKVNVSKKYKDNTVKTIYHITKIDDDFKITKMEDKT